MTSALDPAVYLASVTPRSYRVEAGVRFPELSARIPITNTLVALREVFHEAGFDNERVGQVDWNPLSAVVEKGSRVVLKPNWVLHPWPGGKSRDCLVTHTHLIDGVLAYLEKVEGCHVVIGDAPIQGCDFEKLVAENYIGEVVDRYREGFSSIAVVDFRKTIMSAAGRSVLARRDCRNEEHFVLFDLGSDSLVQRITTEGTQFRVTDYNPTHLEKTHASNRHQYLVAREILAADLVINLPKLKTHKKSGLTGALKNMVGINGHKEFLPHHRKGGSKSGGDCYAGRSLPKALAEGILDFVNRRESPSLHRAGAIVTAVLRRVSKALGGDDNLEGSWFGNDTVWRMALDLQRILYYGRRNGSLAEVPQRKILTITDAVIAGQDEGPLAPAPCPLGVVTMGRSTAAIELVHACLMGLDPERIPIVRQALRLTRWPLIDGGRDSVRVMAAGSVFTADESGEVFGRLFGLPQHWQGHCERESIAPSANEAAE